MNKTFNRLLLTMIGAWLLGLATHAAASKPADITDAEIALLPGYCPDTMGFKYGDAYSNTSPNAARWVAMMGKGFWHVHHYCWALIEIRRAERSSVPSAQKKGMRESALGNLLYVLKNTGDDFVLRPEILTWVGRMGVQLNQPQAAGEAFARARALKPDYWPAYFHWAEYLQSKGQKAAAMNIVKTGLQHAPTAKALQLQFRDLGGKPGEIPPPIIKPAPPPAADEPNSEQDQAPPTPPVPAEQSPTKLP